MTKDERQKYKVWLDSLEAGDEVCIQPMRGASPTGEATIDKVKFRNALHISVESGYGELFHSTNGRSISTQFQGPRMLVPVSDEARRAQTIRRTRHALNQISWWDTTRVPDDVVLAVMKLIETKG